MKIWVCATTRIPKTMELLKEETGLIDLQIFDDINKAENYMKLETIELISKAQGWDDSEEYDEYFSLWEEKYPGFMI